MHKLKVFFITTVLTLTPLACSLTEQTQASGAVMAAESMSTLTAPDPAKNAGQVPATMQPTATSASQPACVIRTGVTGGRVNMRACAGTGCAVVMVLSDGDSLAVLTVGVWPRVRTADNLTGYVNSKFVICEAGK